MREARVVWRYAQVMENIIEIRNISFKYEEEAEDGFALENVSLDIERGSFVAVVGRNGSGKSTLAKMMNAILKPASGTVTVDGFDTADDEHIWDIRQRAGMVFQNPDNQLVSAIVEDDVAFGPENIGTEPEKIRELVDEALMSVHMEEYAEKAPHLLSGGQKQRVAIAGVIAMRPACIIFDEPTAMLDPRGREDVLEVMEKLHGEGITVVLITHFMDEAVRADQVAVMDEGRIISAGSPAEVFSDRAAIEKAGLELPLAMDVALRLREKGVPLKNNVITCEELVDELCRLK